MSNHYVVGAERQKLANELELSEAQVKVKLSNVTIVEKSCRKIRSLLFHYFRCGFKIAERNTKKKKNLKSWVNVE